MPQDNRPKTRRCPFCAETILAAAVKCRFCLEFLVPQNHPSLKGRLPPEDCRDDYYEQDEEVDELEDNYDEETPKEQLAEYDEDKILYQGSPSIFASTRVYFCAAVIFAFAALIYNLPIEDYVRNFSSQRFEFTETRYTMVQSYRILIAFGSGMVSVLYLVFRIIMLKSIGYEVTADRIEWSRGIFSRKIDNVDMFRVVDLKLHRSAIDCLLGIGTVTLYTNDKSDPRFDFFKVRRPRRLYNIMKKAALQADSKQNVIHVE